MTYKVFFDTRQALNGCDQYGSTIAKSAAFMQLIEGQLDSSEFQRLSSPPVTRDDILLVHDKTYIDALFADSRAAGNMSIDSRALDACLWSIGSMVGALTQSLYEDMPVCSCASDLHGAKAIGETGIGFLNGLMVTAAKFIQMNPKAKVGILDLSFQEVGFSQETWNENPGIADHVIRFNSAQFFKNPNLNWGEFLAWIRNSIDAINSFSCDAVIYQASAEMHLIEDLHGFFGEAPMRTRDGLVFGNIKAPIAWNVGGGSTPVGRDLANWVLRGHLSALLNSSKLRTS